MLVPITAARWAEWCAQPGTDAFGCPWSSWDHIILTDHQAEQIAIQEHMMRADRELIMRKQQRQQQRKKVLAETSSSSQMELCL